MKNSRHTNRHTALEKIFFLVEIGLVIVPWVCVFLNPDSMINWINANTATLLALNTLWGALLNSQISRLRDDNEELKEISRSIQSTLLHENAGLHKQHLADQQQILMLDTERKSLYLRNCQLETSWKQLEDLVKQHTPTPFDDEKNEEPSENQHLTALGKNSTI